MNADALAAARIARTAWLAVLGVALAVRLAFVLFAPATGGDWDIYERVAANILRGCGVSLSDPAGAACVPHFGGNQLPGYPGFVALIFALTGHSEVALRIAQALLATAAIAYVMHAVRRYADDGRAALAAGLFLGLSPLAVAWPRFLVTEALAVATTTWVLAELILSLAEQRLRLLPLALALVAALFVRLDAALLAVPVALAGFLVHRPAAAVRRGAILALLVAVPLAAWTVRNIAVGLPSLWPTSMTMPDNSRPPVGYIEWGRSWMSDEYQKPGWGYTVNRLAYDRIAIDGRAYDSPEERARVEALLAELRRHTGQAFPKEIDDAFAAIAAERNARHPLRAWLGLPLRRAWSMWANPFSSYGWPTELSSATSDEARLALARGGLGGALAVALDNPWTALGKAVTASCKFALLLLFLVAVALAVTRRLGLARRIVWIAGSYVLARTAVYAWSAGLESRYMIEAVPFIEVAVAVAAAALWRARLARRAAVSGSA